MSKTVSYPAEYLHLSEDAKKVIEYVEVLNDPDTSDEAKTEASFRLGLRTIRMETELQRVNEFVRIWEGSDGE